MRAMRVLRFSGPEESREDAVALLERMGLQPQLLDRDGQSGAWLEVSVPAHPTAGVDGDQQVDSMERLLARPGVGYRLREYLTTVDRRPATRSSVG